MKTSLRKGRTSFEFQYEFGCEDIQATMTCVEIKDKTLIVSTVLTPPSDDRKDDLNELLSHRESIADITVHDGQIRKSLMSFHKLNKGKFDKQTLSMQYMGVTLFTFVVKARSVDEYSVGFEVVG